MEGIVLRLLPCAERDHIITLMTTQGIIKLFVKGGKKDDLHRRALISPLTRGDYLFQLRKNELHRFIDGSVIDQHLELRDSLEKMQAAQKMVRFLLKTQLPSHPSAELYLLFARFLKRTCNNPNLLTAFLIKLLKHEGILEMAKQLTEAQAHRLRLIAGARSFEEIEALTEEQEFAQKIENLFDIQDNESFSRLNIER